jgi:muramoyltetrapeptide carboxypeptidase
MEKIPMDRRTLLKSAALAGVLGATHGRVPSALADDRSIIKPRRLVRGMRVGLVAPASPPREAEGVRYAIDVLRSFGFEVVEGAHLWERNQYLAGTDRQRAEDVNRMFSDESIEAIFCLRGGYGTSRILPYLDYEAIRANPKIITGFSDITGLILAIHARTGLVTFHGPVAQQGFTDYTLTEFRNVMMEPVAPVGIAAPPPIEQREGLVESKNRITRFVGGKARGPLIGGNLSLLVNLVGTPYEPDFQGRILFLEDVDEAPYRVDRMLTQLWLAGKLQRVAGVALGKFSRADYDKNTFSLEEVFEQRFGELGVPAVRGLMIGHVTDRASVPLGVNAELDGDAGTLTLLETAVT